MSENEQNEPDALDVAADAAGPSVDAAAQSPATESPAADGIVASHEETAKAVTPDPESGTPIEFGDLPEGAAATAGGAATLELLYDLSLPLTVELGRAALKVQDVLSLGQGSVVRLDRVAGDPVDVYVGSKKLAQAEVVVLEEQFGIRITHIYPDAGTPEV
ncbi:MAG: flagellar motor switch protein FliN [Gemmatimonadetes bacterium]|nr:flagellar motor switch protein FliN [Gemmatimonadota bacterium]